MATAETFFAVFLRGAYDDLWLQMQNFRKTGADRDILASRSVSLVTASLVALTLAGTRFLPVLQNVDDTPHTQEELLTSQTCGRPATGATTWHCWEDQSKVGTVDWLTGLCFHIYI